MIRMMMVTGSLLFPLGVPGAGVVGGGDPLLGLAMGVVVTRA